MNWPYILGLSLLFIVGLAVGFSTGRNLRPDTAAVAAATTKAAKAETARAKADARADSLNQERANYKALAEERATQLSVCQEDLRKCALRPTQITGGRQKFK